MGAKSLRKWEWMDLRHSGETSQVSAPHYTRRNRGTLTPPPLLDYPPPDFWTMAQKEDRTRPWMRRCDSHVRFARGHPRHPAWMSSRLSCDGWFQQPKHLVARIFGKDLCNARGKDATIRRIGKRGGRDNTRLRKVTAAGAVVKMCGDNPGKASHRRTGIVRTAPVGPWSIAPLLLSPNPSPKFNSFPGFHWKAKPNYPRFADGDSPEYIHLLLSQIK